MKVELDMFIQRSKRTRRLTYAEIRDELGWSCFERSIRTALHSMGYHKRLACKK